MTDLKRRRRRVLRLRRRVLFAIEGGERFNQRSQEARPTRCRVGLAWVSSHQVDLNPLRPGQDPNSLRPALPPQPQPFKATTSPILSPQLRAPLHATLTHSSSTPLTLRPPPQQRLTGPWGRGRAGAQGTQGRGARGQPERSGVRRAGLGVRIAPACCRACPAPRRPWCRSAEVPRCWPSPQSEGNPAAKK